ncbi:glycosyltransferase [Pontibacter sp. MBLB2868]|uniref:glycosyltransferase n=1 Tax=Pontibacter sp. MBLB2868 TaxID=3451555 RepID=UPI003F74F52C
MRLGVTVVICTYNGAALLPETLHHLAKQRVRQGIKWEIVVINNASTDHTAQVALEEWEKHQNDIQLTLYHQPKQGLTFARELGFKKASYEFVLFCDDDNWLNPDYINLAYDVMLKHPNVGVLGGYGELLFESPPPYWAKQYRLFANGPQASTSGKVPNNKVYGAGFVVRKTAYELLIKAGFKPMLTDRKAGYLSSGGDYEICYAIALAGYDIWYDENLVFKHFMPQARINPEYYIRFIKEGPESFEVLVPYRVRANSQINSSAVFYLKLVKIVLTYTLKLIPELLRKQRVSPDSEEASLLTLKIMSIKSKIFIFRSHATMKENFLKIKRFEQHNLKAYKMNRCVLRNPEKKTLKPTPYKVYKV